MVVYLEQLLFDTATILVFDTATILVNYSNMANTLDIEKKILVWMIKKIIVYTRVHHPRINKIMLI